MVYYRLKNIKGHNYWYLQESYRDKDKVKTRTLAYIGKLKPSLSPEMYSQTKLGTTITKKEQPKMDWYQPKLLPDGTFVAHNRDRRKKYTYKINWGISNPYHLKVYYEDHLIYENKLKTKTEMRAALEEQLVTMNRMDAQKAELGTTEVKEIKITKQEFKNRFYDKMSVERKVNPKSSIFPLYNALHNYESAKMINFKGSTMSKKERLSEIEDAYKDASSKKKLRGREARKLIQDYNAAMGENIPYEKIVTSKVGIRKELVQNYLKTTGHGLSKKDFDIMFGDPELNKRALKELEKEDKLSLNTSNKTYQLGTTRKTKGDRTGDWLSMHPLEVERELDKYTVKEMKEASTFILKKGDKRLRNKEQMKQRILQRMSAYASRFEFGADEPSSPWVKKS